MALRGKRVVLVVENNAVPFDKRVWREALTLRDAGAYVIVICPAFGDDASAFAVIEGIEIHRYRLAFSGGSALGYLREYALAFIRTTILLHKILMTKGHVDVVHVANPPDIFWPLAPYLRILRTKFIFDEHDLTPETYLSRFGKSEKIAGILYSVLRVFQLLSYRFSHVIISTNESYRARAITANGAFERKTFVVRNGPDTRYFKPVAPDDQLKRGFRYMAAYIGIMGVQDGVEYIVKAIDFLQRRRNFGELVVYLIGTGDDLPRIKNLVVSMCLEKYFVFTGRIPDGPALEILSTADICLSPDPQNSLNDLSTMNKVMEYMSLGKSIVSFDLKEARVSAGDAALYVQNNSAEAFGDGMLTLLNDPARRSQMGKIGERRIREQLCWQIQSANLLNAYNFLLRTN